MDLKSASLGSGGERKAGGFVLNVGSPIFLPVGNWAVGDLDYRAFKHGLEGH
jgi:hypothetical protein